MVTSLLVLVWALPLAAAAAIAALTFTGLAASERDERITSRLTLAAISGSVACAVVLLAMQLRGMLTPGSARLLWFASGDLAVALTFQTDVLSLALAVLFACSCWATARFAVNYMHRERGFHRFFLILSLFTSAILLLVTGGNALLTFAGWEVSGLCSYLLVAYFYDRHAAAGNATRVFVTNRIGDAAFVLGTLLAFLWIGSVEWSAIAGARVDVVRASAIAACFAVAAICKAAQVPFSPWLMRSMEGPTPSSALFYGAVMVHGGVYLLLRIAPLLEQTPLVAALLVAVGVATAAYGFVCGLVQIDMKSALAFSSVGQLGLMVAEAGLGWSTLAALHLGAHGVWRGYQFLTAPSILAQLHGERTRPVRGWLAEQRWLYNAALNRGWLEEIATRAVVVPTVRVASDLARFDTVVIDRATGLPAPAVRALSSLAGWEERRIGPTRILDATPAQFAAARGVVGSLTAWAAGASDWFEDRLIVKTISDGATGGAHRLGGSLQWLEVQLERPFVVAAAVVVSLFALLSGVPR